MPQSDPRWPDQAPTLESFALRFHPAAGGQRRAHDAGHEAGGPGAAASAPDTTPPRRRLRLAALPRLIDDSPSPSRASVDHALPCRYDCPDAAADSAPKPTAAPADGGRIIGMAFSSPRGSAAFEPARPEASQSNSLTQENAAPPSSFTTNPRDSFDVQETTTGPETAGRSGLSGHTTDPAAVRGEPAPPGVGYVPFDVREKWTGPAARQPVAQLSWRDPPRADWGAGHEVWEAWWPAVDRQTGPPPHKKAVMRPVASASPGQAARWLGAADEFAPLPGQRAHASAFPSDPRAIARPASAPPNLGTDGPADAGCPGSLPALLALNGDLSRGGGNGGAWADPGYALPTGLEREGDAAGSNGAGWEVLANRERTARVGASASWQAADATPGVQTDDCPTAAALAPVGDGRAAWLQQADSNVNVQTDAGAGPWRRAPDAGPADFNPEGAPRCLSGRREPPAAAAAVAALAPGVDGRAGWLQLQAASEQSVSAGAGAEPWRWAPEADPDPERAPRGFLDPPLRGEPGCSREQTLRRCEPPAAGVDGRAGWLQQQADSDANVLGAEPWRWAPDADPADFDPEQAPRCLSGSSMRGGPRREPPAAAAAVAGGVGSLQQQADSDANVPPDAGAEPWRWAPDADPADFDPEQAPRCLSGSSMRGGPRQQRREPALRRREPPAAAAAERGPWPPHRPAALPKSVLRRADKRSLLHPENANPHSLEMLSLRSLWKVLALGKGGDFRIRSDGFEEVDVHCSEEGTPHLEPEEREPPAAQPEAQASFSEKKQQTMHCLSFAQHCLSRLADAAKSEPQGTLDEGLQSLLLHLSATTSAHTATS
ncbi:hypothetical protein DIPPA_16491 [Diplonema papillatum]|nr:hypothetical protein DIPPA_16491 [Diplonema papillatum]